MILLYYTYSFLLFLKCYPKKKNKKISIVESSIYFLFTIIGIFRATLSCKRTTLFCRLPLFPFASRPEAMHLGDLLRWSVRMSRKNTTPTRCLWYSHSFWCNCSQRTITHQQNRHHTRGVYSSGKRPLAPNDLLSEDNLTNL